MIGLLDLYGLDYPPKLATVAERHDWAVKEYEQKVGRTKFRMFFAVHEFEAWLLAQPEVLPRAVQEQLLANIFRPEQVDFNHPPARVLEHAYLSGIRRTYKKATYGPLLVARLDTEAVAAKCPYLKKMLEAMLALAKEAGC